jgi:hypothetical protein
VRTRGAVVVPIVIALITLWWEIFKQRIAMTLTHMHATVTLLTVATPWYGAKARETEENTGLPYGEVKDSI